MSPTLKLEMEDCEEKAKPEPEWYRPPDEEEAIVRKQELDMIY